MEADALLDVLQQQFLFRRLSREQIAHMLPHFHVRHVVAGEKVVEENQASCHLFIVVKGELSIRKRANLEESYYGNDHAMIHGYVIAQIQAGEIFGELGFLDAGGPSATVRAETDGELLWIDYADLKTLKDQDRTAGYHILYSLAQHLGKRLRSTSDTTVSALQERLLASSARNAMGQFLIYVVLLLSFYNLTLEYTTQLAMTSYYAGTLVSVVLIGIFAVSLVIMVKRSGLPLRAVGVTRRGWRRSLWECGLFTLAVMALTTLIKWILIETVPQHAEKPLFDPVMGEWRMMVFDYAIYGLFSPFQEFVARGVLQSSLERYLPAGNWRKWQAIVISNALFCAAHVHLSPILAFTVFFQGLFWGWLYARERTLIGVSVSHILIGWWGLFILNYASLFGGFTV